MNEEQIRSEAMLKSQTQQIGQYSVVVMQLEGTIAVLQAKLAEARQRIAELSKPAPDGAQPEGEAK